MSSQTMTAIPDSVTEENLKQKLENNLEQIKSRFASFVHCIRKSLIKRGVPASDLRTFVMPLLPRRSEVRKEVKKATTIDEIFEILEDLYASFLNYNIYLDVIENFDINDKQEKLNYPHYIEEYIKKHQLSEFFKINPKLENFTDESKKVILKMDMELTKTSLADLVDVVKSVANILLLSKSDLRILDVKEGCLLISLLIPTKLADSVFIKSKKFTADETKELQSLSVMWLECNGHVFKFAEQLDHGNKADPEEDECNAKKSGK